METINSNLRIPLAESGKIYIISAGAAHNNEGWEEMGKIMIKSGSQWGEIHPFEALTALLVGDNYT